jgi:hypothetical protein
MARAEVGAKIVMVLAAVGEVHVKMEPTAVEQALSVEARETLSVDFEGSVRPKIYFRGGGARGHQGSQAQPCPGPSYGVSPSQGLHR